MANVNDLARALDNVLLGNLIEECVITFEDDKAYIKAMDLTSSLYIQTVADIEHDDIQIGVGSLPLFVKYLHMISDVDVTIKHKDTRMMIKPKTGGVVNYKLAQVDLIPTFDSDWGDLIEEALEEYDSSTKLKQVPISEFLSIMGLFTPNSVYFEVDSKGKVILHGGKETSHMFEVELGKIKGVDPCSLKVYGKHLTPVLSSIDYNEEPRLYLKQDDAVIISTNKSSWILQLIKDE